MHGYQLMQAIAERSGGAWTPSPGAVYPTISQLEDEGLATISEGAGRRVVTLTDEGREHLAAHRGGWGDPFDDYDSTVPDLRRLAHDVLDAVRQVGRAGSDDQRGRAATILTDARRALYLLLADGDEAAR